MPTGSWTTSRTHWRSLPTTCMCQTRWQWACTVLLWPLWMAFFWNKESQQHLVIVFFQESCPRNWMHFVCLAANYERTHNNDLTVHAETWQLPRTFSLTLSLILAMLWGTRGRCNYLPKDMGLWEVKGLVQGEYTGKWQNHDPNQQLWFWFRWSHPHHSPDVIVTNQLRSVLVEIMKSCILILLSFL